MGYVVILVGQKLYIRVNVIKGSNSPIQLGLIGGGNWGIKYIQTINEMNGVLLKKIVTRNKNIDTIVSSKTQVSKNWESVVQSNDLDGVILSVPAFIQPVIAEEAIKNKMPVLLEKPLALSLDKAQRIQSLANNLNVFVMVDHTYLFNPAFIKLKEKLKCENSPVVGIESISGNYGPFRKKCTPLWDWGPHDISMCLDLVKDPIVEISASESENSLIHPNKNNYIVRIIFNSGILANLKFGNLFDKKTRIFKVKLELGEYNFNECCRDKLVYKDKKNNRYPIAIDKDKPLNRVVQAFAKGIKNSSGYSTDFNSSIKIVKILQKIENKLITQRL